MKVRKGGPLVSAIFALAMILGVAGTAVAQRTPTEGMAAVGGEVGLFFPSDEVFESAAPTLAGTFEYYVDPRVSLRAQLGWTDPDFDREEGDSVRDIRLLFNVVYNWERIAWHPFVTAGVGAYFLQEKDNGHDFGPSHSKVGLNLGGGIEYFTTNTISIKGEGLYHFISDNDLPWDPSGLTLTVGLKKYF